MSQKEFDEDDGIRSITIGDEEYHLVSGREAPPPPKKGRGGTSKYPMKHLEVGESFKLTGVKPETVKQMAYKYSKSLSRKFRVEAVSGAYWMHRVE